MKTSKGLSLLTATATTRIDTITRSALVAILVSIATASFAQSDISLESEDNRIGYSIGVNIGQNLIQQGIVEGIEIDAFIAGMMDSVAGNVRLDDTEIMTAIQTFVQRQQEAAQNALAENLSASEAFLAENGQRDGVVTLDSGLQYEIMESGAAGGQSPTTANSVLAHYHGTLTDGSVFDSSVQRGEPATFGVSQVIAGWTEALQLMKVGDKWRLFIPPNLAYGEASPTPAIPPNSALIFEVELLEVR